MQMGTHFGQAQRSKATAQQFLAKMRKGARGPALESGDGWVSIQWANAWLEVGRLSMDFWPAAFFWGWDSRGGVSGDESTEDGDGGGWLHDNGGPTRIRLMHANAQVCDYKRAK